MSNSNPVNIAILGAGRQGKVHAAAIAQIGAPARLYMIFDVFPAAAEALAASHVHAPTVAASIEQVLQDPEVHAVVIVTPNNTHADLVLQVAAAGKACLCEKPLDRDLENIEKLRTALKEVAKTRPLPYMAVGFPKRHDPTYTALRAQLRAKTHGELEHLIIHGRDEAPQPTEYMKYSGGMITDTCVHDFDLARALIGDDDHPVSVFTQGSTLISPDACEAAKDVTRVTINVKTAQGRLLTIMNSRRCVVGNDQRVEAHCSLGDLLADNPPREDVHLTTTSSTTGGARQPYHSATAERYAAAFLNQMRELVAAVQGGGGPLPAGVQIGSSIEDGWWASKAVAAATISLREGRVVLL